VVVLERASQALRERVLREVGSMLDDDGSGLPEGNSRFEAAWERYLIAEQRALVARAEGILARSLTEALPGESQEELDRTAQEDRRLARQGFVELMDEEGETYHKHLDELEVWDVADRLRADTARSDWLAMRTQQRNEQRKARLSDRGRLERRNPTLTDRELEILKGLARGLSNGLLAEEVHLSKGTVKCHLANIYERIGVRSRGEAVAKGVREGWLLLDDIVSEDILSEEIASEGSYTATDGRYRCVVEGCGREIVVVRTSRDETHWEAPACHGLEMMAVSDSVPNKGGPLRR
jgi:DNA-binding CsgD family transcriptional regulator